ncbi:MAG: hypothetical protein IT318_03630 [Anaerolineales bacterium]|nr:hypothetical protein [Anaerolineales bacterium]
MTIKRYAALSLLSVAMLALGLAALAAPAPLRGPLLLEMPAPGRAGTSLALGLMLLGPALHLADVAGLVLLTLATVEIWVLAIAWELRRHRRL